MEIFLTYIKVFCIGGLLCALAQILVVRTKITPARILILFLLLGVLLQTVGVYEHIYNFCKSGISVPIVGFGATVAKKAIEMAKQEGVLGALKGGLVGAAGGLGFTIFFSYIIALICKPKTKKH